MFNGFKPDSKKYRDLVGLLQAGRTIEEVAAHLDANPEYVARIAETVVPVKVAAAKPKRARKAPAKKG